MIIGLRAIYTFFFFPSILSIEYTKENNLPFWEEFLIGVPLGMTNVFWWGLLTIPVLGV